MHLTPAGLPLGIPGMGDDIEGAMQQAPHPTLHFIVVTIVFSSFPALFGVLYTYYTLFAQYMET